MSSEKLMIVDGNSIMNRAFYGLRGDQLLATSDGLYTNAVYGFINILHKFLEEEQPQYICVAFDLKAPTFRHKEFEGYKAGRKAMPDELAVQFPVIKEVLDAMNIKRLEYEGYEADDIIGAVSLCAERKGMDVIIVTGDRDSLQLATEKTRIKIPVTRSGRTETDEYDHDKIVEKYGVTPAQLIDVKGLMGDPSDNIPGVQGIGEKTALELIRKFGSIEALYNNLDKVEKNSVRQKLEAGRDMAFMSKGLAAIIRDMPFICEVEDLKRKEFDKDKLYKLFKRLEFKSFIEKFNLAEAASHAASAVQADCLAGTDGIKELKEAILKAKKFSLFCLIDKDGFFSGRLAGMAVSTGDRNPVYIDFARRVDEKEFLREFQPVFEDHEIKKIGHDMKGFILYLKKEGIRLDGLSFDTMIAAYIINPSRETYTVSELSELYEGKTIESVEQLSGKGKNYVPFAEMPPERISCAAAGYSEAILRLVPLLESIMKENGQTGLYYDIELPLVEVLADMEYHGFKVDVEGLKRFSSELDGKIESITGEIYELAGEQFNINSTRQLGAILFEKLGLPVIKKTKTGYSTDADVLEELAPRHGIVSKILEYRQLMKLKTTYAEGLLAVINPATGKIHSSFNQTVTATGRISSTEPNLQNIPVKLEMGRKIRSVFIPENENYILADADYSQIELRVLAHITEDEALISAFLNNEDIHTSTASRVFGIPADSVTPLMRSRAKAVNFGIIYGIGDFSLARDLGITRKEARKYIDEYLDKYPGVREYMRNIVESAKEKGYVTTLFNRRRYLPELKSSNFNVRSFGERVALNTPIQGSAADIIKIAMVRVYRELKKRNMKSRLILQVHDELIVETHLEEKEEVLKILKESMENAANLRVPLTVEVKTGKTWYETK